MTITEGRGKSVGFPGGRVWRDKTKVTRPFVNDFGPGELIVIDDDLLVIDDHSGEHMAIPFKGVPEFIAALEELRDAEIAGEMERKHSVDIAEVLKQAIDERDRLKAIVAGLEWVEDEDSDGNKNGSFFCPYCGSCKQTGHDADCVMGKAIKQVFSNDWRNDNE